MTRVLTICCVLWAATALVHADMVTYYEDHFDGSALGPAWNVWGTGSYSVGGGTLSFMTEQGDFHPAYYGTYGPTRHVFLVSPPSGATQWTAVTRVRFNTPDQSFEQVMLMGFADQNNYAKVAYDYDGPGAFYHVMLSQENAYPVQTDIETTSHADYFWMRLERNGNTYTGSISDDATTNPDLVSWTVVDSLINNMANPMAGIGGCNVFSTYWASGELAEFDYFRLQIPEPSALAAAVALGLAGLRLRRHG